MWLQAQLQWMHACSLRLLQGTAARHSAAIVETQGCKGSKTSTGKSSSSNSSSNGPLAERLQSPAAAMACKAAAC